jgi:murein DD-endopeptidase MepM/ murein hydrolase activator NlpD
LARNLRGRVGPEAAIPVAVALIVLSASVLSWLPGTAARGSVGGPTGNGPGPRIAVGGIGAGFDPAARRDAEQLPDTVAHEPTAGEDALSGPGYQLTRVDPDAVAIDDTVQKPVIQGAFDQSGTLIKPISVVTTVADGRNLLKTYKVQRGDTLTGIAHRYGVSTMTIWWANNFKSSADFRVGRTLTIPPVNGLVVNVEEGDTLESIGKEHDVAADVIYETNGLQDTALVVGQTLVLPGAEGAPMPTRRPIVKPTEKPPSIRPPADYSGGAFIWPVVGGSNYISQYFHVGHYGLDIAADYGSRVRAVGSGTVIFAGWKNNGGGYQVYIAHGSNLYTTYNHMSAVSVAIGQSVAQGQQVGRVGQSGWASGPHLHFEVWIGRPWDGGTRVNPLLYL